MLPSSSPPSDSRTVLRREDWATPQDLFDKLHRRWRFTQDVCADLENTKCPAYFTKTQNALQQRWAGTCWMNPPYGRGIWQWVRKAALESQNGTVVVALLPASTGTNWWHDWVIPYARIRFLRGRLRFGGATANAPFDSALAFYPRRGAFQAATARIDPRQLSLIPAPL